MCACFLWAPKWFMMFFLVVIPLLLLLIRFKENIEKRRKISGRKQARESARDRDKEREREGIELMRFDSST